MHYTINAVKSPSRFAAALLATVMLVALCMGFSQTAHAAQEAPQSPNKLQSVDYSTQSVDKGNFLVKFKKDHDRFHVTIKVGSDYQLRAHGKDLAVVDSSGNEVDRLPLPKKDSGKTLWSAKDSRTATVDIPLDAIVPQTKAQPGSVEAQGAKAPSDAWYDCMSDKGWSAAVSTAVAGCALAIEIGCVEGAAGGFASGAITGLVSGLWSCKSKY